MSADHPNRLSGGTCGAHGFPQLYFVRINNDPHWNTTGGTITLRRPPRSPVTARYIYIKPPPKRRKLCGPVWPENGYPAIQVAAPKTAALSAKTRALPTLVPWARGHPPKDLSFRTLKKLADLRR